MKKCFLAFMVLLSVAACHNNNVKEDKSLGGYFTAEGVEGSFGIFDNGKGTFKVYNLKRFRDSTYLPASTFKIINALVGLETGKITDTDMVIPWNGIVHPIENWNQDVTMKQAFQFSSAPWFQEIARRIGKDTLQHYLDTLGYASKNQRAVIQQVDTFWLDNSVKITADEQLGLVKSLYFDQLPFQPRSQRLVRDIMLQEDNSNYILAYKTGWGKTEAGNDLAWAVGWIEENRHPYFFALNLESKQPEADIPAVRKRILMAILKDLGFLEGKK